jgi:iron(III) transport system ATP-binding protein
LIAVDGHSAFAPSPTREVKAVAGFVRIEGLRKRFGSFWAIDDVSFEIAEGSLLVLLGPSGCGKTTTLRCIGGLEHPDEGRIVIDGQDVTNPAAGIMLPPEARGMGMVAQSYAIWPHMTVFENIAFPLKMRKQASGQVRESVEWALDVVRLKGLGNRNATDLSGGQQQRVALARAIVARPKVLLFDEPLSNLDAKLREQMRFLIKRIQKEIGITAVYVTHDQEEAMGLGDELIVMNGGRIEQRGSARNLYMNPASHFVADFIGVANFIEGSLVAQRADSEGLVRMRAVCDGTEVHLRCRPQSTGDASASSALLVRPEWIEVSVERPFKGDNIVEGRIESSQYLGERTELIVSTCLGSLRVSTEASVNLTDDAQVWLVLDPYKCIVVGSTERDRPHV